MAAVGPNPAKIKGFKTAQAFERWMRVNHARETEVWLRVFKKNSGKQTVTIAEALDISLCWGWIDGIRKSYDEESFLQRYSPRRSKSVWSRINRANVSRLTAEGRMQPSGQRHIDAAKADGRWRAPYPPVRRTATKTTR